MPAFLLSLLGDWKVLLLIALAIGAGVVIFKVHSLESALTASQAAVKQEKENNVVLRNNVDTLTQVNSANQRVLEQQAKATKTTVETLNKLSKELSTSSSSFNDIQRKLDGLTVTPVPLTPYLKEAIDGIQAERDKLNPPVAVAAPTAKSAAPTKVEVPATSAPTPVKKWTPVKKEAVTQ